MPAPDHPPPFDPSERLGRGVNSSKQAARAAAGTVVPIIFRDWTGEISVDGIDRGPLDEIAAIRDELASHNFYGWAAVTVEQAKRKDRQVDPDPTLLNKYHSVIRLPIDREEERRDIVTEHATELAAVADWQPRP